MTEAQLEALGPALAGFLERFVPHFRSTPTFGHLRTYTRGLLSDLPRKTAEPMALAAGTPVRTLQEFLKDHLWDHLAIRNDLQQHVAQLLPTLTDDGVGTVGLIDETSVLKKGDRTPGVARQYLGCVGKVDNGLVTVHLGVCRGTYKTLLDADLFLPQCWSDDRKRCRAAGIPDEVVHRPKWQIALEQLDRARANGVQLDWLTFDSEYGKCPALARGLDERQQRFVGEVPPVFSCKAAVASGQQPDEELTGQRADEVVRNASGFRSQSWQVIRLSRATAEDQLWRVKGARVWVSSSTGWSSGTYWLVWASCEKTGEEKLFLSNAPADSAVEQLIRVAFRRAGVEHAFRLCKSELGFTHFEGRNYRALQRHLILSLVVLVFVAGHTQRLRGEKSGGDGGAGVPGIEAPEPGVAGPDATERGSGVGVGGHRLPPKTQSGCDPVQEETHRPAANTQKTKKAKAQKNGKVYC